MVGFSSRLLPNILKYREHRWNLSTPWKTRLFETHLEEFSYRWTRCFWSIKGRYDHCNHLGSYRNVMEFQVSSRKESRQRDTQVIRVIVARKGFRKQLCFIRCRRQYLQATGYRRHSRFTFVENTISNSPNIQGAEFLWTNRLFCFSSMCKFGSFKNAFATVTVLTRWPLIFGGVLKALKNVLRFFSALTFWRNWFLHVGKHILS